MKPRSRFNPRKQSTPFWLLLLLAAFPAARSWCADPFVLGSPPALLTGLITIAHNNGYYRDQGLDLQLVKLPTGDDGLRAINAGRVDAYVVGDVPFIKHLENNPDLRIIATVGEWGNETRLITRSESGIKGGGDLKGRRIAAQRGSAFHYFLDLLLARNGLSEADIQPVFLHTKKQPDALVAGDIDAAVSREPYLGQVRARLGDQAVVLEFPGLMIKRFVLVTSRQALDERAPQLTALLEALHRAEKSVRRDPERTAQQLAELGMGERAAIRDMLRTMRMRLTIDNHLLYTLEKVDQWWQGVKGSAGPKDVNYLDIIVDAPLQAAKPQAVLLKR